MNDVKMAPEKWLETEEFKGIQILDPDGWDRKNYDEDWAKPLTREAFLNKLVYCTCIFPDKFLLPPHNGPMVRPVFPLPSRKPIQGESFEGKVVVKSECEWCNPGNLDKNALEVATLASTGDGKVGICMECLHKVRKSQ